MTTVADRWAAEPYCYLTTVGRKSGRPHEIEIWFAALGNTIYLMNGSGEGVAAGQSDWVKNVLARASVHVRIGGDQFDGVAQPVEFDSAEHELARDLLVGKYATAESDLVEWLETGFPVSVVLMAAGEIQGPLAAGG